MKKTLSITQRFVLFVSIFSIVAVADLWFYINSAKGVEKYTAASNILSSIKGDIVALEYATDIFIVAVAGDFKKGYGTEGLKDNAAVIGTGMERLEKLPIASIFGGNIALSEEYRDLVNDWKSVEEKIAGISKTMSREEAMLTHNDIDLKTFLIKERLERLDKFIYAEKTKAALDVKNRAIYGFIFSGIVIFIIAYIFYRKTLKPIKVLIADAAPPAQSSLCEADEIDKLSNILSAMSDTVNKAHNMLEKDMLERARELEAKTKEFAALNRVAGLASRTLAQDEILGAALDELIIMSEADAGWVYLAEPQSGGSETRLHLNAHRGVSYAFIREAKEIRPEDSGIVGGHINGRGHFIINLADIDSKLSGLLQDMGVKKLCILPIIYTNNTIGIISLAGKGADCFSGKRVDSCVFAESMANETAIAIEHARLFQKEFKSRQFMERIVEQFPISIAVFDKNGTCIMLNNMCKKLFGIISDDQIVGRYNLFKDNELEEKGYAHIANRIFEGESVDMGIEYDMSNVRHIQAKAGPKKLKIKAFPIADNDGSISNIVLIYEDVTKEYELKNMRGKT